MKIYTIDYSHYYRLVPTTKRVVRVTTLFIYDYFVDLVNY